MHSYLFIALLLWAREAESYPTGAPRCVSIPGHGLEPQTGELEMEMFKDITR